MLGLLRFRVDFNLPRAQTFVILFWPKSIISQQIVSFKPPSNDSGL